MYRSAVHGFVMILCLFYTQPAGCCQQTSTEDKQSSNQSSKGFMQAAIAAELSSMRSQISSCALTVCAVLLSAGLCWCVTMCVFLLPVTTGGICSSSVRLIPGLSTGSGDCHTSW
jgi:hypothetical protein